MLPDEFEDFDAGEIAEELFLVEKYIESCQARLVSTRKELNTSMQLREDLIDRHKLLSQHKGWHK
jgi:hypothetical protein